MKRFAIALALLAGCGGDPPATTTAPQPTTAPAACERGAACATDGETCVPDGVGTGWAHGFVCSGGSWQDLEIAPMPVTTTPP